MNKVLKVLIINLLIIILISASIQAERRFFWEENKKQNSEATGTPTPRMTPKFTPKPTPSPSPRKVTSSPSPRHSPIVIQKGEKWEYINEGDKFTYRITWQGELAGYSRFTVIKKLNLAGEVFYKTDSRSELKIGMGRIEHQSFSSQMTFRADDFKPTYFACKQKYEKMEFVVDCLISNNLIAQRNQSPHDKTEAIINFEEGKLPHIYMNNLWGRIDTFVEHYWLLLLPRKTGKFFIYDPVLQYKGEMEIVNKGRDTTEIDGKKLEAHLFQLRDFKGSPFFNIWTDNSYRILKIQEPGGGITFELTENNNLEEFKRSKGVDMWKNRVSRSNVFFPNAKELTKLQAEIELKGRGLSTENFQMPGFSQDFSGENIEGSIKGIFTVNTSQANINNPPGFPVNVDFPAQLIPFIRAEIGIESSDDLIHHKALEATWKSTNIWEASQKINQWVNKNISFGIALPSAKMTLTNEQGNSESRALLAIAMCRSVGIPARRAGGIIFSAGNFIPHYWYEVYVGESSWVGLDPSSNEAGNLSATHVKLFGDGEIWDLKAKVIDYEPKLPSRVTFINRELTWPVGEERIYAIRIKGQKVGVEIGKVEEVTVLGESESYRMTLSSKLSLEGDETNSESQFWITPEGLPLRFEKTISSGKKKDFQSFQFKDNLILQKVKNNGDNFNREIPISRGVYLADSNFLLLWALIAGQFPEPGIGKSFTLSVFIPETLTVENLKAEVKSFESVEAGEKIYEALRLETNKGIVFWIEKQTGKVLKVSFKTQEVDIELLSSKLKI